MSELINRLLSERLNVFLTEEKLPIEENQKWWRRQIRLAEEEGSLTSEDKRKIAVASLLWASHSIISTGLGNTIAITSIIAWKTKGNPLILAANLIPGALRVGTIFASERLFDVRFSRLSKLISFWPVFPSGYAMVIEIAMTLGKRSLLFAKIAERYHDIFKR